jgi:putative phosphoesterase
MLIAILSDSHDDDKNVRRTLELCDQMNITEFIHCGDVGGQRIFDQFVGRSLRFVWGNTDYPRPPLRAYLQKVGIPEPSQIPNRFTIDGKSFALFHGHERSFQHALFNPDALQVDYILHGHTHIPCHDQIDNTTIINPGALHRANPKTFATLNPQEGTLTHHSI